MTILSDWGLFFPILNACILAYVVWRLVRDQRTPPIVTHCLITRESECLLLRDPALLCAACRAAVVLRAHDARATPTTRDLT